MRNTTPSVLLFPLGDAAVVVQFGEEIAEHVHQLVRSFAAFLNQNPFSGFVELVPAFTTVTVFYDPWVVSQKGKFDPYERVIAAINVLLPVMVQEEKKPAARVVEVPVVYGGEFGPDLELVAQLHHISPEEVIYLHTEPDYRVYMIGFVPGFPYLGGMNERIATPRKATPRPKMPAGAVAIGGNQTGIYPLETPGGWHQIGQTPLCLFDPNRASPSLLKAGDMVRFVSISAEAFLERKNGKEILG